MENMMSNTLNIEGGVKIVKMYGGQIAFELKRSST